MKHKIIETKRVWDKEERYYKSVVVSWVPAYGSMYVREDDTRILRHENDIRGVFA